MATGGRTGAVTASLRRDGVTLASVSGPLFTITNDCEQNIQNWNAWVVSSILFFKLLPLCRHQDTYSRVFRESFIHLIVLPEH